jgi:hypothetical protein
MKQIRWALFGRPLYPVLRRRPGGFWKPVWHWVSGFFKHGFVIPVNVDCSFKNLSDMDSVIVETSFIPCEAARFSLAIVFP